MHTLRSLILLGGLLVSVPSGGASSAMLHSQPANAPYYWLPGGVEILSTGNQQSIEKLEEFPDNKEARSWFVGFWKTLDGLCPANPSTQANITRTILKLDSRSHGSFPGLGFTSSVSEYIVEAQPIRPEGGKDAALFAQTVGCAGAQIALYNSILVIMHKSVQPEPRALGRFLALASPAYRKTLGYTEAQAYALLHPPQEPAPVAPVAPVPGDGQLKESLAEPLGDMAPTVLRSNYKEQKPDVDNARAAGQLVLTCIYGPVKSLSSGRVIQGNFTYWYKATPPGFERMLADEDHPLRRLGKAVVNACPQTYGEAFSVNQAGHKLP